MQFLHQNSLSSKVDEYLKAEMQNQRIPGLAVAIIKDGQVVYAKGHGMANVEHQVGVKPETIFQSGSVGKQFTAAAVMLLVEDGKIGLDDRIAKYFTDSPEHWKNITVRHLLTHTAGTTDYPPDFDFRRDYTEDELLKKAADIPLAFQPGERWSYSNIGLCHLRHSDRQSNRQILRRFSAGENFQAAGNGHRPHHQRRGYHSKSFIRLSSRQG
ncbi:MAG: beta-lactamase family protein [Acidobacteria bacterium]|nr:beta-lactamase family protein [Acidobacteriota bacterium]